MEPLEHRKLATMGTNKLSNAREIDALIAKATSDPYHHLPRAVVMVATPTDVIYTGAGGYASLPPYTGSPSDLEKGEPINEDSIYELYSCTKLLASIAAMQCLEKGLFSLDDEAEKYLPELAKLKVLEKWEGDEAVLVPQKRKITIQMLFQHTSGIIYPGFLEEKVGPYMQKRNMPVLYEPDFTREVMAQVPLSFQPGEGWAYGLSNDWLGLAVEAVTGVDLATYIKENIFKPLEITDTTFFPPSKIPMAFLGEGEDALYTFGPNRDFKVKQPLGGAGLSGSPRSYLKILQALINNGVGVNGARILREETIERMYTPQLESDKQREDLTIFGKETDPFTRSMETPIPGVEWGLGGLLSPADLASGRKKGSMTWSGAANTWWFVDPTTKLAMIVFGNSMNWAPNDLFDFWREAETLVYAGLPK